MTMLCVLYSFSFCAEYLRPQRIRDASFCTMSTLAADLKSDNDKDSYMDACMLSKGYKPHYRGACFLGSRREPSLDCYE